VTIGISQPTFLPWLGYFNLIAQSDVFVFLDTVQFERQSWQSRNRIRTRKGEIIWLSVPTEARPLETPLKEICVALNPPGWRRKHVKTIEQNYGCAPFFDQAQEMYRDVLGDKADQFKLADLNCEFISRVCSELGLKARLLRASQLPVTGSRVELLLNLCRHVGATVYYSNAGSAVYLEESKANFEAAGITLNFQKWEHPTYKQGGHGFLSNLSCIDAIAFLGKHKAAKAVRPIGEGKK